MQEEEIWKDIEGYEGLYQVSNMGRVKSLERKAKNGMRIKERIKKVKLRKGYYALELSDVNGNKKTYNVHRLVAQAFLPNPDNLQCINHRDENTLNNMVDNLEWCTHKYNVNYGTCIERRSKKCINGKRARKINQLTLDREFIREWASAREVQRQLGFSQAHISKCCNGKYRQSYGFIWEYAA